MTRLAEMKNPYREGSKLHDIFNLIADGKSHTIEEIAAAVYPSEDVCTYHRRRVASALRTIRSHPGLNVSFDGTWYRMNNHPVYKVNEVIHSYS